ncbi:mucin-3A [Biomphalaria pfeifferi]|uniref:Mucin-3A n=1 Tax=Biomphalaria pfeifferi TaxID=112525 RepID=A0AAD8BFE9_BIOPF|nr:mucin-3A [Biomphalaria pfeifferi]
MRDVLYSWIIVTSLLTDIAAAEVALAKSATVCNGPCGQLSGSCPSGHKLAIRDVLYRVQYKNSACSVMSGCNDTKQEACCETMPQDCVLPFSLLDMQSLQRNCSDVSSCVLQTRYPDLQNSKCAPGTQQKFSSWTVLNYMCINDNFVTDMCGSAESVVKGKTIFAMAKSKTLAKGMVCTCKAEVLTSSSTDIIALFVVDMRMNRAGATDCSDASLSVRSGNGYKNLDCSSSLDPKVSYPFVAVVNDSNVVYTKLQIRTSLTELIWIGFESNENQDIRLTCQLQISDTTKVSPVDPASDRKLSRNSQESETDGNFDKKGILIPAIIGGVVAGIVLITIVIISILVCTKKLTCPGSAKPLGAEHDAQVDFDIYYSTTNDEMKKLDAGQTSSARNSTSSAQDLYISPEDVRAKKRSNSKRMSQLTVRDFENDEEYVTTFEIQHRKRMSKKNKIIEDSGQTSGQESFEDDKEYDRLDCRLRRPSDDVMESYDRLGPTCVRNDTADDLKTKSAGNGGATNLAYEDTELQCDSGRSTMVLRPLKSSEQENPLYTTVQSIFVQDDEPAPDIPPKLSASSLYDVPRRSSDYNVALSKLLKMSARGRYFKANPIEQTTSKEADPENCGETDNAEDNSLNTNSEIKTREMTAPVAAPRRKRKSTAQSYDVAKPIQ